MPGILNTYRRLPIALVRGQGSWVWDEQGRRYLDGLAGIAVSNLGHGHPELLACLQQQASKIWHSSNLYQIREQSALAERLCHLTMLSAAFFCNSGAEAFETAFKVVRRFAQAQHKSEPKIVVMEGAFHGRSFAGISASHAKIGAGFEPLVPGFIRVPFGDVAALETLTDDNIVALMLEPVQGEGGIRLSPPGYLQAAQRLCRQRGWLLLMDEIQAGLGRTGFWWAHQEAIQQPDIILVAKGLANGLPIGACVISAALEPLLEPGMHGSTFGGGPLVSGVALKTLELIEREDCINNAAKQGAYLLSRLRAALIPLSGVVAVRGRGLMLGIELQAPCREMLNLGLKHGVLFNITQMRVCRLLPPLNLSTEEAELLCQRIVACVHDFLDQSPTPTQ